MSVRWGSPRGAPGGRPPPSPSPPAPAPPPSGPPLPAGRAGETATAFTFPAATVATAIGAAAAGVLAGSDLYPAREFGLAVAAGLVIDLLLLRVPLIAALARWGGG